MSQKLLRVAELNTMLDQFGWKDPSQLIKSTPITAASKTGYSLKFTSVLPGQDWMRVRYIDASPQGSYGSYAVGANAWDPRWEVPNPAIAPALETPGLSAAERAELERLDLF